VSDKSGEDRSLKGTEDVKVQHAPSGQSALEELSSQNQGHGQNLNLHEDVGHEHLDHVVPANAHTGDINPIYMQPSKDGGFNFTKKEFVTSIQDDKAIVKVQAEENRDQSTITTSETTFTKSNTAQGPHNIPGSELGFTKIYFGKGEENANQTTGGKAAIDFIAANEVAHKAGETPGVSIPLAVKGNAAAARTAGGLETQIPTQTEAQAKDAKAQDTQAEQTAQTTSIDNTQTTDTTTSNSNLTATSDQKFTAATETKTEAKVELTHETAPVVTPVIVPVAPIIMPTVAPVIIPIP